MAVWTDESKVLFSVVSPVSAYVIYIQLERLAHPYRRVSTIALEWDTYL
jgi:hypothetical protein